VSAEWAPVVQNVLEFLEKILPGLLAAFIGGYSIGKSKSSSIQKELQRTKLNLKYKENEDAVEKDFAGYSDSDLIEHAINSARKREDETKD